MTIEPEIGEVVISSADLNAVVRVTESAKDSWKEDTLLTAVSRNGAAFSVSRKCAIGRLITLVISLDPELRAHDRKAKRYEVTGIVQYCNEDTIDGERVYHVGVGFTGKTQPASFKADPAQNYRIVGMTKDGLWAIEKSEQQFKSRTATRYWVTLAVTITLIQKKEKTITKEETFTKNIGAGGVSVVSDLSANVGDMVKFACKTLDFYAMATVRKRRVGKNEPSTLHLEFVGDQFPVERLLLAQKTVSD